MQRNLQKLSSYGVEFVKDFPGVGQGVTLIDTNHEIFDFVFLVCNFNCGVGI